MNGTPLVHDRDADPDVDAGIDSDPIPPRAVAAAEPTEPADVPRRGFLARLRRRRLASLLSPARFGQFLSVGAVGALVDNATLVGFVEVAHLPPLFAKLGSAELAIVLMFVLNERWTFAGVGDRRPLAVARRLLTSNVVRAGGALVALLTIAVLTGGFGVWYLLANVVGIGLGVFVNYAFEGLFTWRLLD